MTKIWVKGNEFLPQTLTFSPYILGTRCRRSLIFQTMNSVRSNILSLKYHRFTPFSCKDIGIRKFEFMAKNQFLCPKVSYIGQKRITLIMDLKRESKPEKSSNVLHTLNTQSIISFIRS